MKDEIKTDAIDALLGFLPAFEAADGSPGEWRAEPGQLPYFCPDDTLVDFVQALYRHDWVVPFDWPAWREEADRFVSSPGLLASADLDVVRKLLTTHVRQDRFCEGHLAEMVRSGHIAALLRRLRELRDRPTIS